MGGDLSKSGDSIPRRELKEILNKTDFSKDEIDSLYKEFKEGDKGQKGSLSKEEFSQIMKERMKGATEYQINGLFELFDKDKSGDINFTELAIPLSILSKGTPQEKLKLIFELYDKNKDDELDVNELKKLVAQMKSTAKALEKENPIQWINALLVKLDSEKKGSISKQEFIDIGSKSPTLLVLLGIEKPEN